jgi:hypothetical protein
VPLRRDRVPFTDHRGVSVSPGFPRTVTAGTFRRRRAACASWCPRGWCPASEATTRLTGRRDDTVPTPSTDRDMPADIPKPGSGPVSRASSRRDMQARTGPVQAWCLEPLPAEICSPGSGRSRAPTATLRHVCRPTVRRALRRVPPRGRPVAPTPRVGHHGTWRRRVGCVPEAARPRRGRALSNRIANRPQATATAGGTSSAPRHDGRRPQLSCPRHGHGRGTDMM